MNDLETITSLAVKAIEAQAAMMAENSVSPKLALKIRLDNRRREYREAATPEAWLALRNEVEALRAALKPFARLAQGLPPDFGDDDSIGSNFTIGLLAGHLRDAARALKHQNPLLHLSNISP